MTSQGPLKPYPSYDVLAKSEGPSWDDVTRGVVSRRMSHVPARAFFTEHEWQLLEAIVARLMPQPDHLSDPIPIVPFIDQKLAHNATEGYRYESLPPMQEAYRKALCGIEQDSQLRWRASFLALTPEQRDALLGDVQNGKVSGDAWQGMSPARFFESLLMSDVVSTYYAHPHAWSEIGFGGPASPRGYVRLGKNSHDSWEAPLEQRSKLR